MTWRNRVGGSRRGTALFGDLRGARSIKGNFLERGESGTRSEEEEVEEGVFVLLKIRRLRRRMDISIDNKTANVGVYRLFGC